MNIDDGSGGCADASYYGDDAYGDGYGEVEL